MNANRREWQKREEIFSTNGTNYANWKRSDFFREKPWQGQGER